MLKIGNSPSRCFGFLKNPQEKIAANIDIRFGHINYYDKN